MGEPHQLTLFDEPYITQIGNTVPKKKKTVRPKGNAKRIYIPGPDERNEPPEDFHAYCALLMGPKGIGKTSASASYPGALNMQWEPRRRNVALRMIGADQGLIFATAQDIIEGKKEDPWPIFEEYNAAAVEDPTVSQITWDTVDIAYQACFESVCASKEITHPNEIEKDYGETWNDIKNRFAALIDVIRSTDTGLLFISHVKEREVEFEDGVGSVSLVGPSAAPACIQILKASCDFWFFYGRVDGKRTVTVRDPTRTVDVACGCGFLDENGEEIEQIDVDGDPDKFYEKMEAAFKGKTPSKKKPVKKKKKGVKKKAQN